MNAQQNFIAFLSCGGFKSLCSPGWGFEQMSPAQQELKPQLILELARGASTVTGVPCGKQKALPTAWRKNAQGASVAAVNTSVNFLLSLESEAKTEQKHVVWVPAVDCV